jgi:hypothetical protein
MCRHPVDTLLVVVGYCCENIADLLSAGYCYILPLMCVDRLHQPARFFCTSMQSMQSVAINMSQRPRCSDKVSESVTLDGQLPNAYIDR